MKIREIPGSIVAPKGFLAGGVFCDIKKLGTGKGSDKGQKRDLAMIVSEAPATVAGLFTTNQVCAAPVKVCLARMKKSVGQAIVANSGNANACTGKQGMRDAEAMAAIAGNELNIPAKKIFVASTGRIGMPMPMANVHNGILGTAKQLGNSLAHAAHAAEAIMTSDSRPKQVAVECVIGGRTVRIGGICKGAGMIQPGMSANGQRPAAMPLHATMLCFITTDAAVEAKALQAALGGAVAHSFNCITVDGDMSTNDTVLVLANGMAGNEKLKAKSEKLKVFQNALNHVCLELAKMIVRDGEGVHRVVTVRVSGAKTAADADAAARAVANSALVKTSWHGGDPNWGRIIDAIGYSAAKVVEEKVDLGYSAPGVKNVLWSLKRGQPTKATYKELCAAVAPKEFDLHIRLNLGKASAVIYAADLTEEYVTFNKGDMDERQNSFNQICLADDRGQVAVTVELSKKHLQKFPKDGPAWLRYGMAFVTLARYAEAKTAIRRAIKFCPQKALAIPYAQMGHLIEARGDFNQAAVWYRKASKNTPDDATFHIFLGSNAHKRGLHKQSEAHYRRALKCSDGFIEEAYFNLGGILIGRRNYPEAIKCYQEALRIDPKYKIAKQRLEDAELALLITNT
jgi:glutamate N-acetyltransferase/amino-acid N-acetyltransferase